MTYEERENAINFLKGYLDEEVYTEKCRNAHKIAIKALEQETVSKESYEHEYFLRKEFELKIDELQHQLEEQTVKAKSILNKIYADIQKLRGCSCNYSDGIIDDVEDIIDTYKEEMVEEYESIRD